MPAAFTRAATLGQGWVAPLFGLLALSEGAAALRRAWAAAGRTGWPRVATGRYFCLGTVADEVADAYMEHYYGPDWFAAARADTLTSGQRLREELPRLADAGATDLVLFPCSGGLEQAAAAADRDQHAPEEPQRPGRVGEVEGEPLERQRQRPSVLPNETFLG